jgi:hypothetical protein
LTKKSAVPNFKFQPFQVEEENQCALLELGTAGTWNY